MHLQQTESNGPAQAPVEGPEKPLKRFAIQSPSLPFGQRIAHSDISGPTYVTAQTLVQQVSYSLSDRLWTYSPETFDLDVAVKQWKDNGVLNAHGYRTKVDQMQVRQGAAPIALGYIFSKDFDLKKRYIPQSILTSTSSLQFLRAALDQLSLLYSIASPLVAHVAAVDYSGGSSSLVTDYVSALTLVEDLGFGMVASCTPYECQHMALFATLLSNIVPTLHIYDGINVGRETTRVIDVLDQSGLDGAYTAIQHQLSAPGKGKADLDTKVQRLLEAFNGELGTDYGLFEYHGHPEPESALVVFGSVESSLASQVASSLKKSGVRIGLLVVRIYRPFVEEEFLRLMPKSVKMIGVLGQVGDDQEVGDDSIHSCLYSDVMAATTFSDLWPSSPAILDIKYPRQRIWTPVSIAAAFQLLVKHPLLQPKEHSTTPQDQPQLQLIDRASILQYTFWNLDNSPSAAAAFSIGQALSQDSAKNITVSMGYDNLHQGGIIRTDIRQSKRSVEASYSIDAANLVYVGDESILQSFDIVEGVMARGKIILKLPGIKDEALEKILPGTSRSKLVTKSIELYILDPSALESTANDQSLESHLVQAAILHIGMHHEDSVLPKMSSSPNADFDILSDLMNKMETVLRKVEIPKEWATIEQENESSVLLSGFRANSFVGFDKAEHEPSACLKNWQTTAKGLAFKEAYDTASRLRPDLSVTTHTVRVAENRRLTPSTYDRNIFHIEFDLGTSGLKYDIGEALGIHAENDEMEVEKFIESYRLDPREVVEVPSREDPAVLENRTVWQALMQNVDIFGRPPKRFYEALADFADDPSEKHELQALGGPEGAVEFKRRSEVDTVTYADILQDFPSAHPSFHDIIRIVSPMKRREYSIASCQKVNPDRVALMIVTVSWVDPRGRDRFGQATKYLQKLEVGMPVTVSIKPSVMKLPLKSTQPLIMAGLGTGLAPFRAFVQYRAWEKAQGKAIGSVLLYMGSRHQREEYCYGEEWEAYQDAGVITLLGRAFSRDQPQKIYIQDRMRETLEDIIQAYLKEDGAFYLCVSVLCYSVT